MRNPNYPPQRVVGGNQSTDEMANLLLGVSPLEPAGLERLREAQLRQNIALDPRDWVAHFNLGIVLGRLANPKRG